MTNAHRRRMIHEAESAILNLQEALATNAQTHKQWAVDETIPLQALQQYIASMINSMNATRAKLRTFRDVIIPADSEISNVGGLIGLSVADVDALGQEIAGYIDTYAEMPKTSYAEIIDACDYLIANVNKTPSVWDEIEP